MDSVVNQRLQCEMDVNSKSFSFVFKGKRNDVNGRENELRFPLQ